MNFSNHEIFFNCGQTFYIINENRLRLILETKEYKGIRISSGLTTQLIGKRVEFAERNSGFRCAITKQQIGIIKEVWIPFLFYEVNEGWQRVAIERTECTKCGWEGNIANPTLPDLYLTLPERFELMSESTDLERVGCPNCNGKLKRFAIWVE
jgi:hypothetical protein